MEQDKNSNLKGEPALAKLLILDEICRELRKLPVQDKFVEVGGTQMLARWLEPLPDTTYPNAQIVKEILQTISILNIDADHLQKNSELGKIVRVYAQGRASNQALAKQIVDKWSRTQQNIDSSYSEVDTDHNQYRSHKRRILKMEDTEFR